MDEIRAARKNRMPAMNIPGYDGKYYVREDGTVWHRGKTKDWKLTGHRKGRSRELKLTDSTGAYRIFTMTKIMRSTYFRDLRADWVLMHINGLEADWSIYNLKPISREELGRIRNRSLAARSVIKRDPSNMQIVAAYSSAREAGRKNYMSYQAVLDACNRSNKKRKGMGPDGYLYEWEI